MQKRKKKKRRETARRVISRPTGKQTEGREGEIRLKKTRNSQVSYSRYYQS